MSLIEFKNLPDTSTPLTAENLNNNFEYLDDKIPNISNTYSESTTDAYSCDYINGEVVYDGGRTQAGNFTKNISEFKRLKIFYSNDWMTSISTEIEYSGSASSYPLMIGVGWGGQLGLNLEIGYLDLNNTSFSTNTNGNRNRGISSDGSGNITISRRNGIFITKIIAYKEVL